MSLLMFSISVPNGEIWSSEGSVYVSKLVSEIIKLQWFNWTYCKSYNYWLSALPMQSKGNWMFEAYIVIIIKSVFDWFRSLKKIFSHNYQISIFIPMWGKILSSLFLMPWLLKCRANWTFISQKILKFDWKVQEF